MWISLQQKHNGFLSWYEEKTLNKTITLTLFSNKWIFIGSNWLKIEFNNRSAQWITN